MTSVARARRAVRQRGPRKAQPAPEQRAPSPLAAPLVDEVRTRLAAAANDATARETRQVLGARVPCYGAPPSQVHAIALDIVRRTRTGGLALALDIGDPLWRSGNLEEGMVAAEVVNAQARHIGGGDFERFESWLGAVTNVVNADGLAQHLVSRAVAAKPSLVNQLKEWAKSPERLRRRAAVVPFGPLVREGRFLTDALSVAELVMTDTEPDVQNGVGALLVEASRTRGDRVAEFLSAWKSRTAPEVLRLGVSKLTPDQRATVLGA